jgi:hypothetical protein
MDTNKILLILGLILLLFLIMRNVKVESTTPTTTKTSTKVVYRRPPAVAVGPTVAPSYNAYKAQYYN